MECKTLEWAFVLSTQEANFLGQVFVTFLKSDNGPRLFSNLESLSCFINTDDFICVCLIVIVRERLIIYVIYS